MDSITSVEEAIDFVDSFQGRPEDFQLVVPDALQDPTGMNMALITDRVLARGWWPNGFTQGVGCRIYRYTGVAPKPEATRLNLRRKPWWRFW